MGYTHYWSLIDRDAFRKHWPTLVEDIRKIIDEADVELISETLTPEGRLIETPLTSASITVDADLDLNGGYKSHEPFIFGPDMEGPSMSFCKTARKPYDLVVAAILLRAVQVLPADTLQVSSDGDWDEPQWLEPRSLLRKLWPYDEVFCPWQGRESLEIEGEGIVTGGGE